MPEGGQGFTIWGDLAIDLSQVRDLPESVQQALMASSGKDASLRLTVDDEQAKAQVASLQKEMSTLGRATAKPQVEVKAAEARGQVKAVSTDISQLSRSVAKPSVVLDGFEETRAKFASLHAQADALSKRVGLPLGGATGAGTSELGAISNAFAAGRGGGLSGLVGAAGGAGAGGVAGFLAGFAASTTAQLARPVLAGTAGTAESSRRVSEAVSRAYGGDRFNLAARALEEQTGFLAEDFQRAALSGKGLVSNYGLQSDALRKLLPVAADFAALSSSADLQTVQATMDRMAAAIRGETRGAEDLGLTLTDTYMKTMAANGAFKDTWDSLSVTAQAQARYNELIKQAGSVMGAAKDDESLTGQVRMFNAEVTDLGRAIGKDLLPPLAGFVGLVADLVDAIPNWVPKAIGFAVKAAPEVIKLMPGGSNVAPIISGAQAYGKYAEDKARRGEESAYPTAARYFDEYGNVLTREEAMKNWQIKIVLDNRSGADLAANVDAGSYAPSPY